MPHGRARRPRRLVEIDRPLLGGDERGICRQELRHGRPAELPLPLAVYDRLAVQRNRANGNMVDLPVVHLT